jgi:uncharacterized membrane protein
VVDQRELTPDVPLSPKVSARTEVGVAAVAGVVAGGAIAALSELRYGVLVGWDVAAVVFMTWVWVTVWRMDAAHTAALAEHQDPTRAAADVLVLAAAVVSLVAVGWVLGTAPESHGAGKGLRVGLGLASVVLSWATVHTIFALRYARLYYTGADGGVDFNQDEPPEYRDFAYLAFSIGMTFQVADTELQEREIRVTALRHSLLSFLFGTGILAAAINLVASLSSQ